MWSGARILYFDHVGVVGGAELVLVDMVRHSGKLGHVVLMADGPLRAMLESVGGTVTLIEAPEQMNSVRRSSGCLHSLKTIPSVVRLARSIAKVAKEYDLIWANSQKAFVVGCFAAIFSRRPLVWHMHDILTAEHFSRNNRRLVIGLANRFATRVVTVSEAGRQSFIASGGHPDLATVVHNGIDPLNFPTASAADTSAARRTLDLPADVPVVGLFGRLTRWKGQHVLLEAIAKIPDVHALLVGGTQFNDDDHAYAETLEGMARRMGLTTRVHFAGFRKDVPAAMSACDLIVHTSTSAEPFGRVIVEAMLSRRPVIATEGGGTVEIITDGVDGRLVPAADPVSLSTAIRNLLDDHSTASRLADAGYYTASERFTLGRFLNQFESIIHESLRARVRRSSGAQPMQHQVEH
jgi:glycosyltransferase involved in cell wall biosynthesis